MKMKAKFFCCQKGCVCTVGTIWVRPAAVDRSHGLTLTSSTGTLGRRTPVDMPELRRGRIPHTDDRFENNSNRPQYLLLTDVCTALDSRFK